MGQKCGKHSFRVKNLEVVDFWLKKFGNIGLLSNMSKTSILGQEIETMGLESKYGKHRFWV